MSSISGHTAQTAERPERSRNAKAQARHRAKRKAYIEQLEQTVTKLQTALGFTPEQVTSLPPPLVKIRELEQENARLTKENDELHRLLADAGINPVTGARSLSLDSMGRRGSPLGANYGDPHRSVERDFKRRKMDGMDDYLPPSSHHHSDLTRPPPLTIPQSGHGGPHHYSATQHTSSSNSSTPGSLFLPPPNAPPIGPPFGQIPNTPSGSSSTSSPPFSPATMHANSNPHAHSHSPVGHRPPSIPHGLSSYASSASSQSYVSVKAEDDSYPSSHQSNHSPHSHSNHSAGGHHYTLPPFSQTIPDHSLDNQTSSWHPSYSSERAPLHR
ncbi:BZIP domain-containing protein [Mycena indigotica]|uniref:BZIP domain-containing protein n=1 Tax=Mycena indigotica TaxID=2126181 RepID=A0A8H6S575_9AGAR|nr:BZIP domain-containing protein [Mycena indigotica]KAF7293046.1 BZIP domain-containing protein [Mycena indigotica]